MTAQQRPPAPIQRRGRLRRALPALVAAAALLVAALGAVGYVVERNHAREEANITAILTAADAASVSQALPGGGSLQMTMSPSHDAAVVVARGLPDPGEGKVYQVWMIDADGPRSQGTFRTGGRMKMDGVTAAESIAVTVEPQGGSDRPTGAAVATLGV